MPTILYSYTKCSSCRDAIAWLRQHGIAFEERPIYEQPPTLGELRRMLALQNGDLKRLFNSSGLEYRALDMKTKLPTLSEDAALALLAGNGRLVKRPFLIGPKVGLLGFKADQWTKALL
jgi:arsenate reductase